MIVRGRGATADRESGGSMDENRLVTIGITVLVVVLLAWLSERFFRAQERRLEENYRGDFASAKTRFRLVRRVVVSIVVLIAVLAALTTIPATARMAQALLASSAVAAVLAGFALRTPLGNVAAGLQIAFTQPFRLGDRISVEPIHGVVEEIKLSYTVLRTDDGRRAYLPNEQLIATPIVNATIEDPSRSQTVTVPVSPDADLERARELLQGVIDAIPGRVPDSGAAAVLGSDLRERAVAALRDEGMLARA